MTETRTAPGMVFDGSVDDSDDAPLMPMLHGFGVSSFFWNVQVHAAAGPGYYAVTPNQRGMRQAPGPIWPITPVTVWTGRLATHSTSQPPLVMATGRFHLVGHDWGASLGWQIADQHPERLASSSPG